MTYRQLIEITIALSQPCLYKEEQEEVYDLLFKYRGTFSLTGEIGTCPNIEVPIFYEPFSCQRGGLTIDR